MPDNAEPEGMGVEALVEALAADIRKQHGSLCWPGRRHLAEFVRAAVARAVAEEREATWRTALTLANNLCVQISDRIRDDDGPPEASGAASDCAVRIRGFIGATPEDIVGMIAEAGYDAAAIRARGGEAS